VHNYLFIMQVVVGCVIIYLLCGWGCIINLYIMQVWCVAHEMGIIMVVI